MTSLTKAQCEEFLARETVNPVTRRKIAIGKDVHKRLMKQCASTKQPTKRSPRLLHPPPMGPVMHWMMYAKTEKEELNNMISILNHIKSRVQSFKDDEVVSMMEMEEFNEFLKEAELLFKKSVYKNKHKFFTYIDAVSEMVKQVYKSYKIVDDRPKYAIVRDSEVKPSRHFIRQQVYFLYRVTMGKLYSMRECLQKDEIVVYVSSSAYHSLKDIKKYMDYLIEHRIFTYDEIYKHTFKSDKIFDEIKSTWKEYAALYRRLKGTSP